MRKQFVECHSRVAARRRCPWAARVAKANDGFWCFESVADYETWRRQRCSSYSSEGLQCSF